MSSISTAYDAVIARMGTLFPSKVRLHNPYELSDNAEITTRDSWGLRVGPAVQNIIEFCCFSSDREMTIILQRQFPTVGKEPTAFDYITKSILEDQKTIVDNLFSPSELGVEGDVDKIDITNISGIQFNQDDQKKYIFVEISFTITTSAPLI